jgi:ubiquinone/menaquinone biosynthesis C-methylase UbiE
MIEKPSPRLTPGEAAAPRSLQTHLAALESIFDRYAAEVLTWQRRNRGYHRAIESTAKHYIPPGERILEIGSGTGDLLASLNPSEGVGIDISGEMTRLASQRHPHLKFHQMAVEELNLTGKTFDIILLSDVVGSLYDILDVFKKLRSVSHAGTRIIIQWHSRLWKPVLELAESLRLKSPIPIFNWTSPEDISNLLYLAGFEVISSRGHTLMPLQIPGLNTLLNRYLANLPGFRWSCLTSWMIARPVGFPPPEDSPSVSIICPCRNEAGNIESIVRRLPSLGSHTELIFVEGHSRDNTLEECRRVAAAYPERDIKVFAQEGSGKGDAVRLGFSKATGDQLFILDADLSVAPEDLPQFFNALASGKGEFVNGSRLVYEMEPGAMRFLNLLGNRAFALILSRLMGQPVKDTLCGTKALTRRNYARIAQGRAHFGQLDPFGDFDLLFGAAKLGLKIVEIPIRYRERVYGQTNIHRFTHGWLLLRMCVKALRKLVLIP